MIRAEIIGAEAVIQHLQEVPQRVLGLVRQAVEREAINLTKVVKDEKLTGQILKTRTGTLRRSINYALTIEDQGLTATVGTNLVYAGAHEYGFDGVVSVRAFTRRTKASWKAAGSLSSALGRMGLKRLRKSEKMAYARSSGAGACFVRAHTRHMVMPERSFLRSSLRENSDRIKAAIEAAVAQGLKA